MRISDWSSDVCSSDLPGADRDARHPGVAEEAFLERRERRETFRAGRIVAGRRWYAAFRCRNGFGRELALARGRVAAEEFGEAVGGVAEVGERGQRRTLHAPYRTDAVDDQRPPPQFLPPGSERAEDRRVGKWVCSR